MPTAYTAINRTKTHVPPCAATQKPKGQPKNAKSRSRASQGMTKATPNHAASRSPVRQRLARQWRRAPSLYPKRQVAKIDLMCG